MASAKAEEGAKTSAPLPTTDSSLLPNVASRFTKNPAETVNTDNNVCNTGSLPHKNVLGEYSLTPASLFSRQTLDGLWRFVDENGFQSRGERIIVPSAYKVVRLDKSVLESFLDKAPMEFTEAARTNPVVMAMPLPDGNFGLFQIEEAPIMEPELAKQFPQIKTFRGQGVDDPTATARFDWTPDGFHAMILSETDTIYIDPYAKGDTENYVTYYKKDYLRDREPSHCLVQGRKNTSSRTPESIAIAFSNGATLRTYRLALAATAEYTNHFRQSGDTDQQAKERAFSAMTTTMNRVNGIYGRELAIRMIFVANQMNIIHTDPNTDPYTDQSNLDLFVNQNQTSLDAVIGSANYDVGHVFSTGGGYTPGEICNTTTKAKGKTGLPHPVGDAFDVDFVAHEFGHQFGANHTFNGSLGNCGGRNNTITAFEPGSGSTIMGYAGICACQDLQPHSDSYFHTASVNEILNFVGSAGTCAAQTSTGNAPPVVDAGPNYTIPKRTPFSLTATGSDANGDSLTYTWEQLNFGAFSSPPDTDEDGQARPIFRSFPPASNPTRTFPSFSDLQANFSTYGESLPTIARTMTFQVTARDNRGSGGGASSDFMQITVNGGSGPFAVTQPNTTLTWTVGTSQTITWDAANTNAAPVSAANVRISLSTDGGQTFPNVLIAGTPNDGSETIIVPNLPTTAARIKIEAVGNIFFDISNVNFTISSGACNFSLNRPLQDIPQSGGNYAVTIIANPGCAWTATSYPSWITITSPGSGAGSGTLTYTAAANQNQYRTGTISIAGKIFTVKQNAKGGALDTPFGLFCGITLGANANSDALADLIILPDGKIIAAGTAYEFPSDFQLVRFNPDGLVDASFGANGVVTTNFDNASDDVGGAILRQNDGKLILIGYTDDRAIAFSDKFALIRYNPDGSLDTGFGNNGKVSTDFTNLNDNAFSGALQSDGKIIAAGSSNNDANFALARYNNDGSLDTTFGTGGKVTTPFVGFTRASDIALQTDGKIVLVGRASGNNGDFALARYNPDGSLDASFGMSGKVTTDFLGSLDEANSLIINDDKIIVAGVAGISGLNSDFALVRYNSNGSLDNSFGNGGKVTTDFQASLDSGSDIAIQNDGKIIVVGSALMSGTGYDFAIARYEINGSLDPAFGSGGKVTTQLQPPFLTNHATSAAIQPDSKIIVGGNNGSSGGTRYFTVARYESGVPPATQPTIKIPFDFDGDNRSDIAVFRPNGGAWYLLRSTLGFTGVQFGISSDLITPGDFDGDGKADVAVFRPSTGSWYRLNSSDGAFVAVQFGQNGDLPRPADFDGDGKDDICVFRPSTGAWFRLNSSNNQFVAIQFGANGDAPVIADFDGDGKADVAVFRPADGAWYWLKSSTGEFSGAQFGAIGDTPSVGDFDGDGKSDISVFRSSNGAWYRLNSGGGQFVAVQFGIAGDVPTVGDYDGDGKSDIAVFRPANGSWYLLQSQSGFIGVQFGINGDKPIPSSFLP